MPEADAEVRKWLALFGFWDLKSAISKQTTYDWRSINQPQALSDLIIFPAREREKVFPVLGIKNTSVVEVATDVSGVYLLRINEPHVEIERTNYAEGYGLFQIRPALTPWAQKLGKTIRVTNNHGQVSEPYSDESVLAIRLWSIPPDGRDHPSSAEQHLEMVLGVNLEGNQRDAFRPNDLGIPIIDPETSQTVAEIVNNTLYILFDLPHKNNYCAELLNKLMAEWEKFITAPPEEKEKLLTDIRAKQREVARQRFVEFCNRRLAQEHSNTTTELGRTEKTVEENQKQLVTGLRRARELTQHLAWLSAEKDRILASYETEFANIMQIPGVLELKIDSSGVIQVFTDTIYITLGDIKYLVGKFRIDIYPDGANGGVRFFNLTNNGAGPGSNPSRAFLDSGASSDYNRHHPHINSNGCACLGNISEAVPQYLAQYQFSVVVILAMAFLQQVDPDDRAGKGIYCWPKADQPKAEPTAAA